MTALRFVDTNILLYSISRHPAEARKRDIAIALLDEDDLALSVQVLQEFYVQATRSTRPDAVAHEVAIGLIRTWLRFRVQEITVPVMIGALQLKNTYELSYWDAAIIAAARGLGCREILRPRVRRYNHQQSLSLRRIPLVLKVLQALKHVQTREQRAPSATGRQRA